MKYIYLSFSIMIIFFCSLSIWNLIEYEIKIKRDLRELSAAEERLTIAKKQLEEANKQADDFIKALNSQ